MEFVMWQESPGYGLEKDKKGPVYSWTSVHISPSSAFKYNSDLCLLTSPGTVQSSCQWTTNEIQLEEKKKNGKLG